MFRSAWCLMTGHSGPSCAPWFPSPSQSPCSSPPSRWRPSRWTGTRSSPRRSTPGPSSGTDTGSWFSSGASPSCSQCPGPCTTLSSQHSHAPLTTDARCRISVQDYLFISILSSCCQPPVGRGCRWWCSWSSSWRRWASPWPPTSWSPTTCGARATSGPPPSSSSSGDWPAGGGQSRCSSLSSSSSESPGFP